MASLIICPGELLLAAPKLAAFDRKKASHIYEITNKYDLCILK